MPLQSSRTKSHGSHSSTCLKSSPSIYTDSSSSSTFASSTSNFASRSSTFFARATSPTRVNLYGRGSSSVRFSINDRSISYKNSALPSHQRNNRTCMCSPTTHPGSFRCSLHKGLSLSRNRMNNNRQPSTTSFHNGSPLNLRRSAMTNSLVRIGGVEGELVKRALTALIRPSSHQQRRRAAFEPRSSRLSVMAKADGSLNCDRNSMDRTTGISESVH